MAEVFRWDWRIRHKNKKRLIWFQAKPRHLNCSLDSILVQVSKPDSLWFLNVSNEENRALYLQGALDLEVPWVSSQDLYVWIPFCLMSQHSWPKVLGSKLLSSFLPRTPHQQYNLCFFLLQCSLQPGLVSQDDL